MLDAAIQYERERGKRARARQKQKSGEPPTKRMTRSMQTEETAEIEMEDDSQSEASKHESVKEAPSGKKKIVRVKDMVQALDGEVLIALGILLEEDIKFHMTANPKPARWDAMEEVDDALEGEPVPAAHEPTMEGENNDIDDVLV